MSDCNSNNISTNQTNQNNQNNQIVNLNFLDREAQLYKASKNVLKENTSLIQKAIEKNTEQEVKDVQTAINNLNKKMNQIMKTDFVKDKQQKIESAQEQMMRSIKEASDTFFKVRQIIHSKENLSREDKSKYEEELFNKIIDKFMTQQEKDMFLRFVNRGPMIMLGSGGGSDAMPITMGEW